MPQPAPVYSSKPEAPGVPPRFGESERLQHLKQLRLESLASHAAKLPVFVSAAACFVGFTVWDRAPQALVLAWIAAVVGILLARRWFSRNYADLDITPDTALRVMLVLSAFNGLLQGGGVALFFPGLSLEQQALVTMIMVCISAGAVSANAAYSLSFYAWAVPMFGALAIAWASAGDVGQTWIALLLVLFPLAQALFVRDNEQVLRESFEIRYDNLALISELELQRAAVAVERDRAEEANRAKSRFLASASHDLRQPLHTLSLYSAALSARRTDERTQEVAREIGAAIHSLATLLDALLDISKLDAGAVRAEPARLALHALLDRVGAEFRPVAEAKALALETELAPVFVETDAVLLERIVRNLVDNAIKYTSRGSVRLRLVEEANRAVLTVSDTGSGIPASEHERIFEEFFQLSNPERDRSKGIGLGLAIVRRLADLLWIDVSLESQPGEGTTFRLSLPAVERALGAPESAKRAGRDRTHVSAGTRVLVVDDEGSVRRGMQTLLESWGFQVTLAAGLEHALESLRSHALDLVIADYRLRGSETGANLIRRAREIRPGIPALLITGDTTRELSEQADELGIALLRKPVEESALQHAIATALKEETGPSGRERGEDAVAFGGRREASG